MRKKIDTVTLFAALEEMKRCMSNGSSIPVTESMTGLTLFAVAGDGTFRRVSVETLVSAMADARLIPNIVTLAVGSDMDADTLTTKACTIFRTNGDMNGHGDAAYLNFPLKPQGGFSVIAIKEGNWDRQIFMSYASSNIYTRYKSYKNGGGAYSSWTSLTPT